MISVLSVVFLSSIVSPSWAHAGNLRGDITGQIDAGASGAGFGDAVDPRRAIAEIIQIALSTIGSLFIILILMAGYWYITARGDESKVEKATKTVRSAIVGLIVVLLAYSITRFVSRSAQDAVRQPEIRNRALQNAVNQNNQSP